MDKTTSSEIDEFHHFINELPAKLKSETSQYIYDRIYKRLFFFNDKSSSFIAWVCPLLKPLLLSENQFLFFEGDDIDCMYFHDNGSLGYVLPKFSNLKYINLTVGCNFGIIDIVSSSLKDDDFDLCDFINHKDKMRRKFTVMADQPTHLLTLQISDLNRLRLEFQDEYEKLMDRKSLL